MTTLTLFDALTMINEGRASETITQLREMSIHYPSDILTNYVLGHALDISHQHLLAKHVWKTASSLSSADDTPQKMKLPDGVKEFIHTESLQNELSRILGEDESDEIGNLIKHLDSADGVKFEGVIEDDDFQDDYSDDDPVTETFARILATQKKYTEAASVYRSLGEQNPQDRERLLGEAGKMDILAEPESDK